MIYLLLGENTYKVAQELQRLTQDAPEIETIDVAQLSESTLSDIVRGGTLFATQRTVIVKQLSERQDLWETLVEWAGDVSDDTTIVLVESKIDKRTKAYKDLVKVAKVTLSDHWSSRDVRLAEEWLGKLASAQKVKISPAQIRDMVQRAQVPSERAGQYIIDQMQLVQALRALSVLDTVNDDSIAAVLPPAPGETIFRLMELAIARDAHGAQVILEQLHTTEDPYRAFGAIASQWCQLVGVAMAGPAAGELSIHPYVLGKLRAQSRDISRSELRTLTQLLADLDARAKLSEVTPWEAVDRFVMAVTLR